ncbi:3268_t:CDS:2 [Gigaspora margarita]|uniref:3268_t:CDS:1 n=1 Tax=Gigaspora margarita TaxID=4874 RepID=A0ABN7VDH7_GIGMA|nr:3268_t:CDS:2 [Gigaspora margarita]
MNPQIEILKIQKRKLVNQHDLPKKKPKTSIESKIIKNFGSKQTLLSKINFKLDVLQDYCLDHWNFYKPTPIFKTKVNYDFCEYLVDELDPLVDSSIVEGAELKLCLNCIIKKKKALFNSIRQLQDSIYVKLKEVKYTKFFYKDVIRVVLRNLYKILKKDYLYIGKYGGVVKNYDFPKNLRYNRDFNYNSDDEIGYFYG